MDTAAHTQNFVKVMETTCETRIKEQYKCPFADEVTGSLLIQELGIEVVQVVVAANAESTSPSRAYRPAKDPPKAARGGRRRLPGPKKNDPAASPCPKNSSQNKPQRCLSKQMVPPLEPLLQKLILRM